MATNTFKNYTAEGVTAETVIYTGPALTQSTIIGMSIANVGVVPAYVSVKLGTTYMVKDAPVPVNGALVVVGGDQKLVVEAGNEVNVTSDVAVDVIISALEIS